ncbi:rhamnulokinase [Candidatus Atribacteria bacterium HGW-Atribacteria-1]|nr:MAG: rhamnulokinase [Candidatus Atribacteria bacterium HGW-Atribacteria-1]
MQKFIAIDIGAESGRVIVGDGLGMEIVYRFSNNLVRVRDSIFWDIFGIFNEIKKGLKIVFKKYPDRIASIGIDTWGVDYVLLDDDGDLLGNPYHYRDKRTDHIMEEVFNIIPKEEIFAETGIQFMQLNTIYQLYSFVKNKPQIFKNAKYFLTIPDLLNYWLTGIIKNEYSIATTTQLYNPIKKDWSTKILDKLGFKKEIFGEIIMPGTKIGKLLPAIAREIGADSEVVIIAPACHDTGSAVAAVPIEDNANYAYISSGTWSLLGIETPEPIINEMSFKYNFTNEGSADGGFRFLKNVTGFWIIQECKKFWDEKVKSYSYDELTEMALKYGPANFIIDLDDSRFLKPGLIDDNMPDRIKAYCQETGQKVPETPAEIVRGVIESLAEKYTKTIKMIEEITGKPIKEIYIIGGGSRNGLLCQLVASTMGLPVYAGPVEATAIGNLMVQAKSMGQIKSIVEGRKIIRESFDIKKYLPEE